MNGPKTIYRLPPCPDCDVEAMEAWLSDMAADGWTLRRDGFFLGLAAFEQAASHAARYRLEAAPARRDDSGGEPPAEAVELSEAMGWQYVASRGPFDIYRTDRADAPELNTDPRVQALALRRVQRRERASLAVSLFWFLICPVLLLHGGLTLLAVETGTWRIVWGGALVLWALCGSLARVMRLSRLHRRLAGGKAPDRPRDWRRGALRHRLSDAAFLLLACAWLALLLQGWNDGVTGKGVRALEAPPSGYPFATLADLAPGGAYLREGTPSANTVEVGSDWLAPVIVKLREQASLQRPDGRRISGGLSVDYYEAASPAVAQTLARELEDELKRSGGTALALPEDLGVDSAAAFERLFPTVVIRRGRFVMRATLWQGTPDGGLTLEEWARVFAGRLGQGGG